MRFFDSKFSEEMYRMGFRRTMPILIEQGARLEDAAPPEMVEFEEIHLNFREGRITGNGLSSLRFEHVLGMAYEIAFFSSDFRGALAGIVRQNEDI